MKFRYLMAASIAGLAAGAISSPASAQSAGSIDFEGVIIVTGVTQTSLEGLDIPDTPKARQVIDVEGIRRQRPGQTANDIINLVPGVSFQNNDPWGSAGGTFTIRGFTSDRISQTVDGIPLNDSGNYALYTNQQVDSEVLEQINVTLGVTDLDSPTASALGGTINMRTRVPSDRFGITATGTYGNVLANNSGDRPYYRAFAMVDSGDITGAGTKMFLAGSYTHYDNPFNNYGEVDKKQLNARIYQDIGSNGDYISIAGHYNENRNNFFGSLRLNQFPTTRADRFYDINFPCEIAAPQAGVADPATTCGNEFDRRYNPSNTGNIRGSSRFTLADGLILTVEPSYQYVKANGGGTVIGYEYGYDVNPAGGRANCSTTANSDTVNCQLGYIGGRPYIGIDLNGDGDLLDQVLLLAPSQTRTHRYGVIANLRWDIDASNTVRISYTHDNANHRQTGEVGYLHTDGEPFDVFPVNDPIRDANGNVLQKRDRQSYAILNQVSGEYRGRFFEDALTVVLGLRAPFFKRELNQNCYTTSASGFVDCFTDDTAAAAAYEALNPNAVPPLSRDYKYDKLLPSVGFTYNLARDTSLFFNYAKGISVPATDPLYNSLFLPDVEAARPTPETTDSFDLGLRFRSGNIQAQLAGWFTRYNDRLASSFDPDLNETVYRNLGQVDKYGIDASIAWMPTPNTLLYVFGSLSESEIKDNLPIGGGNFAQTAGKRESGSPTHMLGARGQVRFGDFELGAQVKHTGKRYINDENLAITINGEQYGPAIGSYTLVDLDFRWNVMEMPTGGNMAVQVNITNLFDELYVGGFGGSLVSSTSPNVQIGAPRAGSVSLIVGF